MHSLPVDQGVVDRFVGAAHGDFATVQELLDQFPDLINARATWDETAIQAAAQTGQAQIAEYLLERGAPLDICTASMLGHVEMVRAILKADPTRVDDSGAHGLPVIYFSCITGHTEVAQALLEHGADLNAGAGAASALHAAVTADNPMMVEWLLEHGARVDVPDWNGKTPLDLAIENQRNTLVEMLSARRNDSDRE